MSYHKGLKRSTPSKIAHRLGAHQHPAIGMALSAGPRGSAELTPCARLDQGRSSTCHAHAAAAACWTAFNAAGKPLPWVPSPLLIASTTYADLRSATNPVGPLPALIDDGAELQDDANAMTAWGIGPLILAPTIDGRYSDVENTPETGIFHEPDTSQLQIAGEKIIDGEYAIPIDRNAPLIAAASLDAGIPLWEGGAVNAEWENLGPNDVAQASAGTGDSGHSQYINGYRINKSWTGPAGMEFEFLYQGSWGNSWAMNGAVWVYSAFLLTRWSLWPFAVVS
jgi:hypothetical protein